MSEEKPIDTVARVTGLSKREMDDIWKKVRANSELLKTCQGHEFTVEERKVGAFVKDWKCAKCGGVVDHAAKKWYELGLIHAKRVL